jgi:hypothetical protein
MIDTKTNPEITTQINEKSLLDMANGAIKERVSYEIPKILANITDPNTDPKKQRTLTITVKFSPGADRSIVAVAATVSSKLQPTDPIPTNLVLTEMGSNRVQAVEYNSGQVPGQGDLNGGEVSQPSNIQQI